MTVYEFLNLVPNVYWIVLEVSSINDFHDGNYLGVEGRACDLRDSLCANFLGGCIVAVTPIDNLTLRIRSNYKEGVFNG